MEETTPKTTQATDNSKPISAMPELTTAQGSTLVPVVDGGNKKVKLSTIKSYINEGMVAQQAGKGLSTNDFTNVLKAKLDSLSNYDDAQLRQAVNALKGEIDTLVSGDASSAIDTFNEIEAFLTGITDTQTLTGLLQQLKSTITGETDGKLANKVDKVDGKGLSANDYTNEEKAAVATIANKVDKVSGKALSTNDYTNEEKAKLGALPTKAELDSSLGAKLDKSKWDEEHGQFTIKGYFLGKRGDVNVSGSEETGVTPLLPLNKTYPIVLKNVLARGNAVAVGFYDAVGTFISYPEGIENLNGDFTVTVDKYPADACYFRACSEKAGSAYTHGPTHEAREGAVSEAIQATLKEFNNKTAEIEASLDEIELAKDRYCVGEWDPEILAPEAKKILGDQSLMADKVYVLADTSVATDGQPVNAAKRLKRTNFLRYEDGSYAPTVVITAEMKAECDGALYLDAAATQQYCEAGAFDPVAFYENKPWGTKLYKADGTEVSHILRPWETTETKYTIGGGFGFDTYLLDQKTGRSGKTWKGIFTRPTTWDGIEVNDPLPPTMLSLSPYTTFGNQARCIFALTTDHNYCKSGAAINNLHSVFVDGRAYPRINDVTAISAMTHCRAMNSTNSPTYPYAEGGYLTFNTLVSSLELLHGTKNLVSIYTSGISSNDACNSETTWSTNGGVKYRVKGTETWKYGTYSAAAQGIHQAADGATSYLYNLTNYEYPKEHCMEAQMAYSFAMERGIAEGVEFDFYGNTYTYKRRTGMSADRMDAIVYRVVSVDFGAFDAAGNAITCEMHINLRMSLHDGFTLTGDIFKCCQGGYEQVLDIDHNPVNDHANWPTKIYVEADQRKWHSERAYNQTASQGDFDFEDTYRLIWQGLSLGNGYCRKRISDSSASKMAGAGLYTGECFYDYGNWNSTDASHIGQRWRRGARFGGSAGYGYCSPRTVNGSAYVGAARRYNGGFAEFVVSARALQAPESAPQAQG